MDYGKWPMENMSIILLTPHLLNTSYFVYLLVPDPQHVLGSGISRDCCPILIWIWSSHSVLKVLGAKHICILVHWTSTARQIDGYVEQDSQRSDHAENEAISSFLCPQIAPFLDVRSLPPLPRKIGNLFRASKKRQEKVICRGTQKKTLSKVNGF